MSKAKRVDLVLALVFLLLVACHALVPGDTNQRNYHFMPDMVYSVAHESQAPPPRIGDSLSVDLRPPKGTIARGYLPFPYEANVEGARLAGLELHADAAEAEEAALERGAHGYNTFCAPCHGPAGSGQTPVTQRGVPPPPSLLQDHARQLSDGELYHIISLGRGNMAGYAAQVERADRWRIIRYVRTLQGKETRS